ncbi:MAG: hypothetical protein AMXMBFR61_02780 [Fimbriimonadales bacterium]
MSGLADEIRSWRPIYQCVALGAAAGFTFGVFAMVGYYVLGEFRGEPTQTVAISTLLCALVIAPCESRWGRAGLIWANAALAVVWIAFYLVAAAYTGRVFVVGGLRGTIVVLTVLPLLAAGSSVLYVRFRHSLMVGR